MKRFAVGVLVGALLFAAPAWAQNHIRLIVNGFEVQSDVPPQIIDGRVMVPVRFVSENLGATVSWDAAARSVTITGGALPKEIACQALNGIQTMAEEVQLLYQGLEAVSDIALDHASASESRTIRQLLDNGKVLRDHAAQVESEGRKVLPAYCGQ